jgi:hypothetical protein
MEGETLPGVEALRTKSPKRKRAAGRGAAH